MITLRGIFKSILPYFIIKNRRNRNKDFSRKVSQLNFCIVNELPKYKKIVSVQGFGYSGSGAVLDLLREYDATQVLGYIDPEVNKKTKFGGLTEIDIIRLPGGLYEIENSLHIDNVFINSALLNRTEKLFQSSSLYKYSDELKNLFISFFQSITTLRIISLSKSFYNGYLYNFDEQSSIYFLKKMSLDEYRLKCSQFLTSIFNHISNGSDIIVADQLFSDTDLNIKRNKSFIRNLKSIIVVRDPRDTYAWAIKANIEWIAHNSVMDFISWYEAQYKNVPNLLEQDDCIVIKYEDLIFDYDQTIKYIENYIGYKSSQHIYMHRYFDPTISKKFVGFYKQMDIKNDCLIIKKKLKLYCNCRID